jgi:imidazolonepropionase-like amidohydrolase
MRFRDFTPLLLAATALPAIAAPPAQTLIRDVAVFDGVRSTGRHAVLIAGDRIVDPDFRGKPTAAMRIVDGTGKTLLPGLIDAHVHAFQGLADPLLFGVTTQLDMFSVPQSFRPVRAQMDAGKNTGAADLYSAGILATVPGGHGTEYGVPIPTLRSPAEADAWVAARIAEGSDYIKIVDEPGTIIGRALPTLDVATIRALVTAAHKRGKLAVVHAQTLATATESIEAGADGLAHLFADKDGGAAFAALAKRRGVFIVPTYTVLESVAGRAGSATLLSAPGFAGLLPKDAIAALQGAAGTDRSAQLDPIEAANLGALVKAGVPILAGTDAGNSGTWYGISLHRELQLLVKGGLTPAQALTAATAAPARAFRLADRGRIAKGLKADLVLVEGDPTTNIDATQAIVEIWKDGQSANALRTARRAELAAAASAAASAAIALPADGRILSVTKGADGKPVLASPFGRGWSSTTDSIAGGNSTVTFAMGDAAPDGQASLVMTGALNDGFIAPWAGVGFNPGAQPFAQTNLTNATALRFMVRGEGKRFSVFAFTAAGGLPPTANFAVTAAWAEVTVRFAAIKGFDPALARLLSINVTGATGPFRLEIANVRLVKE